MKSETFQAFNRLGNRFPARLLYFFLGVQLVISAMIFLFDSGFPSWIMIAGWVVLLVWTAVAVLRGRRRRQAEAARLREEWKRLEAQKARLRKRLSEEPQLRTACATCGNRGGGDIPCRVNASMAERSFQFHVRDAQRYCLLWEPADHPHGH